MASVQFVDYLGGGCYKRTLTDAIFSTNTVTTFIQVTLLNFLLRFRFRLPIPNTICKCIALIMVLICGQSLCLCTCVYVCAVVFLLLNLFVLVVLIETNKVKKRKLFNKTRQYTIQIFNKKNIFKV